MGSSAGLSSSRWESLPARPPTPPREAHHDSEPIPREAIKFQTTNPILSLQTPPNLPTPDPSTTNSTNTGSRRGPKRVGFSAEAEYKEPPTYLDVDKASKDSPPPAPPSGQPKPVKGILKPSYAPNPLDYALLQNGIGPNGHVNIAAMLESTIKELAGADRDSKLDAYMTLVRALKVSNNLPDRIALQDKMSLFVQFIQRDLTSTTPSGAIDSSLINHALTLIATFLHYPAIASTISNDFGIFVIDNAIRAFNDKETPKDVVRHFMQVVGVQDFPPKVMTSDRVGRLVKALRGMEDHLKGKSIVMSRTFIYRQLVKQAKSHMATHSDWLFDLFTDMLSSMKEIRSSAIDLGLEAAYTFGKEKQLSKKVLELLSLSFEEMTYIQYYLTRLRAMVDGRQESSAVPRIWSVITLFFRSPLVRWEYFNPWLALLQTCFNSSDNLTKQEANLAWSRFVYVLHLDDNQFTKSFQMLCQPLESQLKRKGTSKQVGELRKVVMGSLCNLFYYAFKPNTNPSVLDVYWDRGVKPIMHQLATVERNPGALDVQVSEACAILIGLFDIRQRLWKEDHVIDNPLVKPEELPGIDPKWLRRNSTRVFSVIGPILQKKFLDIGDKEAPVDKVWRTLVGSVASAASKEIKVSVDTSTFISDMFGLLLKVWSAGVSEAAQAPAFLASMREYIIVVVDALGPLPFTEKMISMTKQNTFAPISTPSHRPNKNSGVARTPLHHLFSILSMLPPGVDDNENFCNFVQVVFKPFFAAKTVQGRSDLAHEMLQSLPAQALVPYGPWVLVAQNVAEALSNSHYAPLSSSPASNESPIGHELREVVKILERGLVSTPSLPAHYWDALFEELCARAAEETGDAGQAIAVIEPLAKAVLEQVSNNRQGKVPFQLLMSTTSLFSVATYPRDRQAVEAARRRLWGASITASRSGSFDPFDNLYRLGNTVMELLYQDFQQYYADDVVAPLLNELTMFLSRCNLQAVIKTLSNLQDGIVPWVRDEKSQLSSRQKSAGAEAVGYTAPSSMTALLTYTGQASLGQSLHHPANFGES
jgi:hypothetical protein